MFESVAMFIFGWQMYIYSIDPNDTEDVTLMQLVVMCMFVWALIEASEYWFGVLAQA